MHESWIAKTCSGLAVLGLAGACGSEPPAVPAVPVVSGDAPVRAADKKESAKRRCAGVPGMAAPQSIAEMTAHLATLPAPVDLPCVLESLPRPLAVYANASAFSAQPSADVRSPRLFVRSGPLTTTVVPIGSGARLLEFSEDLHDGRSVKAELEFPLSEVTLAAAFERIAIGEGTTCGACHEGEERLAGVTPRFASRILHPMPEFDVPLANIAVEAEACGTASATDRCRALVALFAHGEVVPASLPPDGRLCHGP